jgi:tyrosinase
LFANETERQLYETAAQSWRMPFWDWARTPPGGGPLYPADFGEPMVNAYGPNGWQLISNPLYSYHFSDSEVLAFNFPLVCDPRQLSPPRR